MRMTLRRSCASCAKSKLSCDLRMPQCSRCFKKKSPCVYANEPLTSSGIAVEDGRAGFQLQQAGSSLTSKNPGIGSFDPFDSYPLTRLPRVHVQRLIHHFLSNIAFQYYPLDLNAGSNPFVVSWWPLALGDPALFHVSLQTASLDEELRAQRGFPNSELLMADSVSLVRRRIADPILALQDETLDSVITLAAIEHGKGNFAVSKMHIIAVKNLVRMRGGINEVKLTNPLIARMVPWVSMLVMQSPQFQTQDDFGFGDGIATVPQWQLSATQLDPNLRGLDDLDLQPEISNILNHLRNIFHEPQLLGLSTTELHDLTCFVLHRLLLLPTPTPVSSITSECVRYAIALYMFIIHGQTYYSHALLLQTITLQLKSHLESLTSITTMHSSLAVWILSIGTMASVGIAEHQWFMIMAQSAAIAFRLYTWDDILPHLEGILWLKTEQGELFRQKWEEVLVGMVS